MRLVLAGASNELPVFGRRQYNYPMKLSYLTLALLLSTSLTFVSCSKEPVADVNVPANIEGLKSADKDTRANACIELAKAGPASAPAVPALIPLLKDADPEIRRLAAYTLMEIGPAAKEAGPTLKQMMNDPDRTVVTQVLNTLRAIDPQSKDLPALPNVTN